MKIIFLFIFQATFLLEAQAEYGGLEILTSIQRESLKLFLEDLGKNDEHQLYEVMTVDDDNTALVLISGEKPRAIGNSCISTLSTLTYTNELAITAWHIRKESYLYWHNESNCNMAKDEDAVHLGGYIDNISLAKIFLGFSEIIRQSNNPEVQTNTFRNLTTDCKISKISIVESRLYGLIYSLQSGLECNVNITFEIRENEILVLNAHYPAVIF